MVGAEPLQAGIDGGEDRLAGEAAGIGLVLQRIIALRREHDAVTVGEVLEGAPDDLLAGPVGIVIRRVEEVDAEFDRLPDERRLSSSRRVQGWGPRSGMP